LALPPHLSCQDLNTLAEDDWEGIFPGYNTYPECFRSCIPYLFASVVYHEAWLRSTLSSQHPIFNSRIFIRNLSSRFKDSVVCNYGYCNLTGMTASGVPKHITICGQVSMLRQRLDNVEVGLKRSAEEVLGKIDQNAEELPRKVANTLLENFSINGAIPVTHQSMNDMFDTFAASLRNELKESREARPEECASLLTNQNVHQIFDRWDWGGRMRRCVPENFTFKRDHTKRMWDLWHFGDRASRIGPYKNIKGRDLKSKSDIVSLSRLSQVISKLEMYCRQDGR